MIHWDKLCQPKGKGELGLRKETDMNKAVLAKTYWRLLIEESTVFGANSYKNWNALRTEAEIFKHLAVNGARIL